MFAERVGADDGVERRVLEQQLVGIPFLHREVSGQRSGSFECDVEHLCTEVDSGELHVVGIMGEV